MIKNVKYSKSRFNALWIDLTMPALVQSCVIFGVECYVTDVRYKFALYYKSVFDIDNYFFTPLLACI